MRLRIQAGLLAVMFAAALGVSCSVPAEARHDRGRHLGWSKNWKSDNNNWRWRNSRNWNHHRNWNANRNWNHNRNWNANRNWNHNRNWNTNRYWNDRNWNASRWDSRWR